MLHPVHKAEAQFHNLPFPGREQGDRLPQCRTLSVLFQLLPYLILIAAENVRQKQFVAVAVNVQRLVNAGLLSAIGTFS